MARRLVILQATIGLLLYRSVESLRPSSLDEDAAHASRSDLAHSAAASMNASAMELHFREDTGVQSRVGDLPDCKKAIKKFFLDSESSDPPAFFHTPEAKGIEQLYKFWLRAMEEKVEIHKNDFKKYYKLFLGLHLTHKFYQQQFEEHVKYTTDLKSLQRFLKGFAESFALLEENKPHSPLMGSYLIPFIEHIYRFNHKYGGFTATVQKTDYYNPPRSPYHCSDQEVMCATITNWATIVDTTVEDVRLPLASGKQIAEKAKLALEAVWSKCFGVILDEGGHTGITPIHPLYSDDKFKPFDVDYATEDHVSNYLGAVFHFALMDNFFEIARSDDHKLVDFIMKAIERHEKQVPDLYRDDVPYMFPATILAVETWFWNEDVQKCLELVRAHFLHDPTQSSMDMSMDEGLFKTEVVQGIRQMAEYFGLDDLPTTATSKYPGAAAKIKNAALALEALNAYWEEMLQAAVTAGDLQWLEHLLKLFADSFAVTADERDMAGGYVVPLVVLHDHETIIDEFIKADVRVSGSESPEVKVACTYPQLKVFGDGLKRPQALLGPAAKKALAAVWDPCFEAFPFEREFDHSHLFQAPDSVVFDVPDYVTASFEHSGGAWLFIDLYQPAFLDQIRKATYLMDWFEPQIALEPVPKAGEVVTEAQLTCARKLRQRLASRSGQYGLPMTSASQGMTWLSRFLEAMDEHRKKESMDEYVNIETDFDSFDRLKKASKAVATLIQYWGKKFDEVTLASPQKPIRYLRTLLYRYLHMFGVNQDEGIAAMYGGFAVPLAAMEREWKLFHELRETKFAQESTAGGCMWARGAGGFDPVQYEQEVLNAIRAVWDVCIPFKTYADKLLGKPLVDEAFGWSLADTRQTLLDQLQKAESSYNWDDPVEELLPLLPVG